MSGYTWDDDYTLHTYKTANPQTAQLTEITIHPQHHRLAMGGGSFSTSVGGWVLRGEGAYYDGKYFQTVDAHFSDGVIEKNYFHYLLGLDFSL